MKAVCVIPARMAASRFPGKPLKKLLGLEMISHIDRRCRAFRGFHQVVVATCDKEIAEVVERDGGIAIMTAATHDRCADRVTEAVAKLNFALAPDDLVLMVQGDEILVNSEMLEQMVAVSEKTKAPAINLISRLYQTADFNDPNTVKVATDINGRALYMSRSCIPSQIRNKDEAVVYQQTGIIAFQRQFLTEFSSLKPTLCERAESVDMMRVIENGLSLQTVKTEIETIGIDTEADLKRAESVLLKDRFTRQYLNL